MRLVSELIKLLPGLVFIGTGILEPERYSATIIEEPVLDPERPGG